MPRVHVSDYSLLTNIALVLVSASCRDVEFTRQVIVIRRGRL